ncbi:multidrug resistance protein [Allomyces macrogynus ATCC 38327]|uniref:Multidrug resistance protein n=1 Tax=Allomyces macrogynus (strain ATCC 38327) TaxID=578462 RepID=A0A0L0T186_ALLM3|nr:multidrug resistance protein [Allomyces macrogynus ATCC 38327]|eukprot:KNE68487.1 multidrug resistance protein [Allomyces macrogynus ATCC 38327]
MTVSTAQAPSHGYGTTTETVRTDLNAPLSHEPETQASLVSAASSASVRSSSVTLAASNLPWYMRRTTIAVLVGFSLFVDMIVYGIVVPILPTIAQERLNMDEAELGFLFGSYALGLLLATPPIAYLSDRYRNRKWPMFFGLAGLGTTTLMFAHAESYWTLLAARIMQGFAAGAPWTVGLSLLADVYPADQLGSVMGPVLSCYHAGFLAGPLVGGWIFELFSYTAPFYFCAALVGANLLLRLVVDESIYLTPAAAACNDSWTAGSSSDDEERAGSPTLRPSTSSASTTAPLFIPDEQSALLPAAQLAVNSAGEPSTLSILSLLKGKPILLSSLVTVVIGSIFSGLEPTLPVHLRNTYHLSPGAVGSVFISLIVPSMVTSTLAGIASDRIGGARVLVVGILAMAIAAPLPALPGLSLPATIAALCVFGGTQGVAMTPVLPAMARYVASKGSTSYAAVYGIFNLAYSAAILFGPTVAGVLLAQFGFAIEMAAFGGSLIVLLLFLAWTGLGSF